MCRNYEVNDDNPAKVIEDLRRRDARERDRERKRSAIESKKAREAYDRVVRQLRPATLPEYQKWMNGYIGVSGSCKLMVVDASFSALARKFFVAKGPVLKLEPLFGAMFVCIIVPADVTVRGHDAGHGSVHFMKDFQLVGDEAYVFSDMEF